MISLASSCQNILNVVMHGQCFFGKCNNRRIKMTSPMTYNELEFIQKWLLNKYNLFIEFPIELITIEHVLFHMREDVCTIKYKHIKHSHSYFMTMS